MASNEVVATNGEHEDIGLTDRQIAVLDKLDRLGAEPAPPGGPYHSNAQIRALQLVFEGRFGMAGPGRGGAKQREERAAKRIAEEVRDRLQPKMLRALDRALSRSAGHRINLDAIKLALEIENREAVLQLKEEEHDSLETQNKEELIATLYEVVNEAHIKATLESAIEGEAREIISDATVVPDAPVQHGGHSTGAEANGSDGGSSGSNGRSPSKGNRPQGENPFKQAKVRRAANG